VNVNALLEKHGQRILVIKPSSLGDIIHTLPLVHALKRSFPESSIGWVVQKGFAPLLECDPAVDTVFPVFIPSTSDPQAGRFAYFQALKATMTTLKGLSHRLQGDPYDLILDLHASFRSGLLGRANPGGTRLGFKEAKEGNTFFQNRLVTVPEDVEHALEKNLVFADYLDCTVSAEDFYLCSGQDDDESVEYLLARKKMSAAQGLIYANPAARWETKFWSAAHWAELADRFYALETPIIFAGSGEDRGYIASITALMKTPAVVTAGECTLPQTAALLKRCALYIGLDSGPMHMAAMAGVPVVALFGPTHPRRVGPYGVAHAIVRAEELDCLECRKRRCAQLYCMEKISVQMVSEAALALLGEKRGLGEKKI